MLVEILKKTFALAQIDCDALLLNLFEGNQTLNEIKTGNETLDTLINHLTHDSPDCAKLGKTTIIHTHGIIKAKRVILAGFGKEETLTVDKIRKVSASAAREAQKLISGSTAVFFRANGASLLDEAQTIQAIVEGVILGTYRFENYKTEYVRKNKPAQLKKLLIFQEHEIKERFIQAAHDGKIIAANVNQARDWTNHPAQYMTPTKLAAVAQEIAAKNKLSINVLNKEDMQKENMNAILAVAQGSKEAPKLILVKYEGDSQNEEIIAFIGKGITFDSGGISLKSPGGMDKMIRDMAGAAAVLAAIAAIAELKLKVNILGVLPCTENMPSGNAYRPGDIITTMSGKTVEVVNTDAEGRLILADALTYAQKMGACFLVDLATLTGACVTALGTVNSGLIANDRNWCDKILSAAAASGEKIWEFPNNEEYLTQIKSNVADLKNSGGKGAGAITGGLFIGQFAGKTPWAHLDIAGTSDVEKTAGYNLKGASGVGVRTLVELAKSCQKL